MIIEQLHLTTSPTGKDQLHLQAHPSSVHIARRAAYAWAVEKRFPDSAPDDFAMVTDELAANAINAMRQATPEGVICYPYGTHFSVAFGFFAQFLCVGVWDACPFIPDARGEPQTDELAESGRGLMIVQALALAFVFLPRKTGKIALAVISG